jgi:hypothetical protein
MYINVHRFHTVYPCTNHLHIHTSIVICFIHIYQLLSRTNPRPGRSRPGRGTRGQALTAPGRRRRAWPSPPRDCAAGQGLDLPGTALPGRAPTAPGWSRREQRCIEPDRGREGRVPQEQRSLLWWEGYKRTLQTLPFSSDHDGRPDESAAYTGSVWQSWNPSGYPGCNSGRISERI